ncbi:hypothetical protein [Defluviimonas sp. SAOS-178_SWC]|uniref:hypothetical protein n=1 Tax=Defluviimonas sp. SAOS-178_SWC TaxID=3121287 RepID=UPI0032218E2D
MRIDLIRRRRGSLSLEAVMIVPFAIVVMLTARYIVEGMLTRQEVAVFTRASTVSAASSTLPRIVACDADRTPFGAKPGVSASASVSCSSYRAEQGLKREKPFFRALRDGARPWPQILRDVDRKEPVNDVKGSGSGRFLLSQPDFLRKQGAVTSRQTYLTPEPEFWDHGTKPYTAAHDPVIWQALRQRNTYKLFPNVFPSRYN